MIHDAYGRISLATPLAIPSVQSAVCLCKARYIVLEEATLGLRLSLPVI